MSTSFMCWLMQQYYLRSLSSRMSSYLVHPDLLSSIDRELPSIYLLSSDDRELTSIDRVLISPLPSIVDVPLVCGGSLFESSSVATHFAGEDSLDIVDLDTTLHAPLSEQVVVELLVDVVATVDSSAVCTVGMRFALKLLLIWIWIAFSLTARLSTASLLLSLVFSAREGVAERELTLLVTVGGVLEHLWDLFLKGLDWTLCWSHLRLLLDSSLDSSLQLGRSLFQKEMISDSVRHSCLSVIQIASIFDFGHLRATLRLMDGLFCFCGGSYWFPWSLLSLVVGLSFVVGRWTYQCWEPSIAPRRYLYNNLIPKSLATCQLFVSVIFASVRRSVEVAWLTAILVRTLNSTMFTLYLKCDTD